MQPLEVFLDEGALDGDARFPAVCAVVVKDSRVISEQIENLIHDLYLQPDFQLEPGAARLESTGFHHVDDNYLAKSRFKALLPRLDFEWMCSSNLDIADGDPYDFLPAQFEWILRRVFQRYRNRRVHFVFEQNQRLQAQYGSILHNAATVTDTPISDISHAIGTKADRVLSVADYCIALSAQAIRVWKEACCATASLNRRREYRDFALIEPSCSALFASSVPKILSNRPTRLADHGYYDVTGMHSESCSLSGSGGMR